MIRLFLILTSILSLREGWQYAVTPHGAPRPASVSAWHEDIDPRPDQDRWYRAPLPRALPEHETLVFRSYVPSFTLFVDDAQIYAFRDPAAKGSLRLHRVTLPRDAAGKTLYARIDAGANAPLFGGAPLVASDAETP